MACMLFQYSSQDELGNDIYTYSVVEKEHSDCGKNDLNESVVLSPFQYQELAVMAGQADAIDAAIAAIDPTEVSAVYGAGFALTVFLSAIAYKIKVAKRLVNLT